MLWLNPRVVGHKECLDCPRNLRGGGVSSAAAAKQVQGKLGQKRTACGEEGKGKRDRRHRGRRGADTGVGLRGLWRACSHALEGQAHMVGPGAGAPRHASLENSTFVCARYFARANEIHN